MFSSWWDFLILSGVYVSYAWMTGPVSETAISTLSDASYVSYAFLCGSLTVSLMVTLIDFCDDVSFSLNSLLYHCDLYHYAMSSLPCLSPIVLLDQETWNIPSLVLASLCHDYQD